MSASELSATPAQPATASAKVRSRRWLLIVLVIVALVLAAVFLLSRAGSFLIVNAPRRSDLIVVMAGQWPKAVQLQKQGYGARILMDVDVTRHLYGNTEADLAADFLRHTHEGNIEICPTAAETKFVEAENVQRCIAALCPRSVLIVNTDFDTRRSLEIMRARMPQYRWSIAASSAPFHDADQYWKHRAWAKTVLMAWQDYLWWKLVDQWRSDVALHSAQSCE